ncbi:MAG: LamG domain-containing protein, partial [Anaerolineae bacterium]|nr:LamG domain-containing protein [Gemmatimonadaceae bacterium]
RSESRNVLDGKPLEVETASAVQQTGNGYLVVRDSRELRITGPLTVSAWFQAAGNMDRGMTIASRALNGPPWTFPFSSWLLRVNDATHLEGSLSDGRTYYPSTWSVSLEPGQWYHAVLTYDGDRKKMFLNGVMQQRLASGVLNTPGIGNVPGRSILIGADESESPGDLFEGAIDDVRVFNRGLPDEEVQSLFAEGSKRYGIIP